MELFFRRFYSLPVGLLLAALCAACAAEPGEVLPLESYQDPSGRYALSVPKGWQTTTSPDGSLLTWAGSFVPVNGVQSAGGATALRAALGSFCVSIARYVSRDDGDDDLSVHEGTVD